MPIVASGDVKEQRRRIKAIEDATQYGPFTGPVSEATAFKSSLTCYRTYFDFLPRPDGQFELYVSQPTTPPRLTRHIFDPTMSVRNNEDYLKWRKTDEWTTRWTSPFFVVPHGNDRYFVTETGYVFSTPLNAIPGVRLKEIWSRPPIRALIHDSDNEKWYAFTANHYFEIADPLKPLPHPITDFRGRDAFETLAVAHNCARVIRGLPVPETAPPPRSVLPGGK